MFQREHIKQRRVETHRLMYRIREVFYNFDLFSLLSGTEKILFEKI